MDRNSILANNSSSPEPGPAPVNGESAELSSPMLSSAQRSLGFPGDDGGMSLSEMAQRDLDAALQLLAERAQYITGASGAAIALREGTDMICRASAGPSAPELGAHLQVNSGLSGASVRTKQILRCDDAETDSRVNRESCRAMGIASVVVMPLIHDEEVYGVFELFSGRANAFEERDITALRRLAEMIQTAIDHAEAAKRTEIELGTKTDTESTDNVPDEPLFDAEFEHPALNEPAPKAEEKAAASRAAEQKPAAEVPPPAEKPAAETPPPPPLLAEHGKIGKCQACGFPVSEGRVLCLDCEARQGPGDKLVENVSSSTEAPEFLSQLTAAPGTEESWLWSHKYAIGIMLVVIATLAVLLLFR